MSRSDIAERAIVILMEERHGLEALLSNLNEQHASAISMGRFADAEIFGDYMASLDRVLAAVRT